MHNLQPHYLCAFEFSHLILQQSVGQTLPEALFGNLTRVHITSFCKLQICAVCVLASNSNPIFPPISFRQCTGHSEVAVRQTYRPTHALSKGCYLLQLTACKCLHSCLPPHSLKCAPSFVAVASHMCTWVTSVLALR